MPVPAGVLPLYLDSVERAAWLQDDLEVLADAFDRVTAALPAGLLDRPLDEDLAAAQQLLPGLAEIPGAG